MSKMKNKPWEDVPNIWKDEKAYLNWLRSSTRRIWSRHPIKIAYKQRRRYKAPVGVNGREVWVSDCEMCGKQSRKTEIDHNTAGGSFNDWESYTEWAKRILWVGFDNITELCVECHEVKTLSERRGITLEEAKVEKEVIAFRKLNANKQKTKLKECGIMDSKIGNNANKRIEQYREVVNDLSHTKK